MSTTVTGPFTQSQNATTGVVPTFVASDRLQLAIMDMLRVDAFMGPPSMDFAGMGTDTKRDGDLNGVGFATTMSASGGEVTAPSASSYVVDYATRSIGEYNLAYTASLQSEVLAMPGRQLTLDDMGYSRAVERYPEIGRGALGDGDHGEFRGEAFDVFRFLLEEALRDEEGQVDVLVAGGFETLVKFALEDFPDGVAVGLDHHAALDDFGRFGHVALDYNVLIPGGKVFFAGGDG